ncbi:MAG: hypothetical protein RLZZ230_34 [Candidatus Parcubacteria bacterium]|jgi:hypothetical protein
MVKLRKSDVETFFHFDEICSLNCNLSLRVHLCVSTTLNLFFEAELVDWSVTVIQIFNALHSHMSKFRAIIAGVTVG